MPGVSVAPPTDFYHNQKTVATAGTAEVLGTAQVLEVGVVKIKALSTNTGLIWVGKAGVTSSTGWPLAANEETYVTCNNIADAYINGVTNGDKVAWAAS